MAKELAIDVSSPPRWRSWLTAVLLLPVACAGGCPKPKPRYVVPDDRLRGLPDDPAALVALADRIAAEPKATLRQLDRARAALQKALPAHADRFAVRWRQARAAFMMAHRLKNKDQLVEVARAGAAHARAALERDDKRVEPHYYLALNLAKIAEARSKMSLIKPMVAAAERARKIDAAYDDAGPLVFLGKVYLTAPAWPVSVGNTEKAVAALEQALKLAPTPLTRVFLGQAYYQDEQYAAAKRQLKRALEGKLEPRWRREAEKTLRKIN